MESDRKKIIKTKYKKKSILKSKKKKKKLNKLKNLKRIKLVFFIFIILFISVTIFFFIFNNEIYKNKIENHK